MNYGTKTLSADALQPLHEKTVSLSKRNNGNIISASFRLARLFPEDLQECEMLQERIVGGFRDEEKLYFQESSEDEILESMDDDYCYGLYDGNTLAAFCICVLNRDTECGERHQRNLCVHTAEADAFGKYITFDTIQVSPEYRGYGIQKFFLDEAEILCSECGAEYIIATVHPDNLYSKNSFLAKGFEALTLDGRDEFDFYGSVRNVMIKRIGKSEDASASCPRIIANTEKLVHNAVTVLAWCRNAGIDAALVGKCICENEELICTLVDKGFSQIADSRLENLEKLNVSLPKMLLRIGMQSEAERIVRSCDISLQSEEYTIRKIAEAAKKLGKVHKMILMIDLGDLREGIFYTDKDLIFKTAEAVIDSPNLELYGIGTNLTCYGSVVPDEENLGILCSIASELRERYSIELPIVSGGNSSSLSLMRRGLMPTGVNHLRIGEAIFLGTDTSDGSKFKELYDDAFILEAEIVEIYDKPSYPIGTLSVNAFGEKQEYTDKGIMRRGILAIGRQNVSPCDLIPIDGSIEIIGGSSDHLITDLSKRKDLKVGDVLRFKLSYGGLLSCYTSPYVKKQRH